jgi:hypothetical protein
MVRKKILSVVLCASAALAQPISSNVERVFVFSRTDTAQAMKEIVSSLRSISNIQQISVDDSRKSVAVQTSADQANLAEWMFDLLDRAIPSPELHEYVMPGGSDDVVRVSYAPHAGDARQFSEMGNAVRSLTEIQRFAMFSPKNALIFRGKAWQVGLGEWLIRQLDSPPMGRSSVAFDVSGVEPGIFKTPMHDPGAVRVFYLPLTTTPQALQEAVNVLRTQVGVMRIVGCTAQRAIALRGTASQVDSSDRILATARK